MSISTRWLVPERIIYSRMSDTITLDDLQMVNSTTQKMLAEGHAPVHHLVDVGAVEHFPRDLSRIRTIILDNDNTSLGWTVMIGSNRLLRFMATILTHTVSARFGYVSALDEAIVHLAKRDATISPDEISL